MSSSLKQLISVTLLLLTTSIIVGFQGPKDPVSPKDPAGKSKKQKKSTVKDGKRFFVRVVFANGNHLDGAIRLKYTELHVKYRHGGFVYHKKIKIGELKSIVIAGWKERKSGDDLYYFYPSSYYLITEQKVKIPLLKRMPMLDKILLENKYGTTTLYSYFADYWVGGQWKNAEKGPFAYRRTNPHGKTVKEIRFLSKK